MNLKKDGANTMMNLKNKNGVQFINENQFKYILENYDSDNDDVALSVRGVFLNVEPEEVVAIDNIDGNAWIEPFSNVPDAIDWLNRNYEVGELENDMAKLKAIFDRGYGRDSVILRVNSTELHTSNFGCNYYFSYYKLGEEILLQRHDEDDSEYDEFMLFMNIDDAVKHLDTYIAFAEGGYGWTTSSLLNSIDMFAISLEKTKFLEEYQIYFRGESDLLKGAVDDFTTIDELPERAFDGEGGDIEYSIKKNGSFIDDEKWGGTSLLLNELRNIIKSDGKLVGKGE